MTRHQLLVHPDIPYTSHNSSMCFTAEIPEHMLEAVTDYCCSALAAESAPGSDPGLCILTPELLKQPEVLMDYGRKAKKVVISKEEAYDTAAALGIHLSEHGGTGQGVIGALAGAGLRLTGNDGRFKGKLRIPSPNGTATVRHILDFGIDVVTTLDGVVLNDSEDVHVGEWVKRVLLNEKAVLLVVPSEDISGPAWKASGKKIFRNY
ncbi:MAG: hypothetical protein NT010_08105 [Proteobacteria bacterium]|nr:hypothetical protein [Pseudomonadota bacterium]